jgi:hypothetical protein
VTLNLITQVHIAVGGVVSIWLISSKHRHHRKAGFIVGLCNQPSWLWTAYTHGQWGILFLDCIYILGYVRGLINNWRNL